MKEQFWNAVKQKPFAAAAYILIFLAAMAIGCWLSITVVTDPYDCRMAEGVTIGGLDVGGMTKGEARKALNSALEESLYLQPLSVHLPCETLTLSPEEADVKIRVREAVRTAYAYGRNQESTAKEIPLQTYLTLNEDAVRSKLSAYAARWDTEVTQSRWSLAGDRPDLSTGSFDPEAAGQTLLLTMGIPTVRLDVQQVYGAILAGYCNVISLCAAGDFSVTPEIVPEALPDAPDMDAIHREITVAPVDDSLDLESFQFVHGSYGYSFDLEQAKALVEKAGYGETLEIPLSNTEPELLGEEVYFRDVLGSCETKHTDDENRNTNLRLLCAALDGVVLQPGEEFSYNGTVGERTEEKGYKPATAYSGTRIVKDVGGGVCQGSTTLYNCALLADLEILERVCHGAKVGYVPLGLDAAVNWNTKTDLRFKNNFHFPIMLKAEVADGYVKMQILGTDEKDYYIEMRCGVGEEGSVTYAVSYKCKHDKETGEQISKEVEARSTYYTLDD
nr:VanW family protein [Oscillospiraceae bacterium]